MNMHLAYCIELEKIVDIQEACQEFFAQDKFSKFHFYCSDPDCLKKKIRVSAPNHYKLPTEEKTARSPHFRKWDEHLENCEWVELEEALDEEKKTQYHNTQKHHSNTKLTRLITRFVLPSAEEETNISSNILKNELDRIRAITDPKARKKERLAYSRNAGSTSSSLEALVSCFEELQAAEALNSESIQIPKHGTKTYRQVFRQVTLGKKDDFVVYYGGARFIKDYGKGFLLRFMDKIDDFPVTLYVAPQLFEGYRPGQRLRRIVDGLKENLEKNPYLRVYWIGSLEKTDKGYSAIFTSLAYVVLRLVYPEGKSQGN